ncbi:MAG: hypothetical protein R3B90_00840 [Planctomycetaceae bacterium]
MKIKLPALATLLMACVQCAYGGSPDITVRGQTPHHNQHFTAPPAATLLHPGPMVAGPGPGVMGYPPGAMAAAAAYQQQPAMQSTTQIRFLGPAGSSIGWQVGDTFAENQLVAPARYNFLQGASYRLKMTGVGREGMVLYPTLQVYPTRPGTQAYLAHNSVPIQLNDEDLDQIQTNNFVTKVIYLPDAKYQDLAAGVEELVSTRLPPGSDPIQVAERRGTIMAVLRVGNMDLEMPGQPGGVTSTRRDANGNIVQTAYRPDGDRGEHVAPHPIAIARAASGVPDEMMMGGPTYPGGPGWDPIAGTTAPKWGTPFMHVGTPIGLPGPVALPLGGQASLRSHTMRNETDTYITEPVNDLVIRVRQEPGINMPKPVRDIEYIEKHPIYGPGETSWPAWAGRFGPAQPPAAQGPQGQLPPRN